MIPSFACYPISISQKRDLFSALLGREKIPCYHLNSQTTHVPCLCKYCSCNTLTRITEVLPSQPTIFISMNKFGAKLQEVFTGNSTGASAPAGASLSAFFTATCSYLCFSIQFRVYKFPHFLSRTFRRTDFKFRNSSAIQMSAPNIPLLKLYGI